MSTARDFKPHYTVRDYLTWEGEWELWYGSAVMSTSPFGPHERCVTRFTVQLVGEIDRGQCKCEVYSGLDWIVNEDTVLRPDVMIVCGNQPERHLEQVPELVVEVLSDSTERMDRGPKKQLYQEQGVSNYLIADPKDRSLSWFELQSNGEFADRTDQVLPSKAIEIDLPSGCKIKLDVGKLFG